MIKLLVLLFVIKIFIYQFQLKKQLCRALLFSLLTINACITEWWFAKLQSKSISATIGQFYIITNWSKFHNLALLQGKLQQWSRLGVVGSGKHTIHNNQCTVQIQKATSHAPLLSHRSTILFLLMSRPKTCVFSFSLIVCVGM